MLTLYPKNATSNEEPELSLITILKMIWYLIEIFVLLIAIKALFKIELSIMKYMIENVDIMATFNYVVNVIINLYSRILLVIDNMSPIEQICLFIATIVIGKQIIDSYIQKLNIRINNIKNEWLKETIQESIKPYIVIWQFPKRIKEVVKKRL